MSDPFIRNNTQIQDQYINLLINKIKRQDEIIKSQNIVIQEYRDSLLKAINELKKKMI